MLPVWYRIGSTGGTQIDALIFLPTLQLEPEFRDDNSWTRGCLLGHIRAKLPALCVGFNRAFWCKISCIESTKIVALFFSPGVDFSKNLQSARVSWRQLMNSADVFLGASERSCLRFE